MMTPYVTKHLQAGIKKAFEASYKIAILTVGPNQELVKSLCKDLPMYNYKEVEVINCIDQFNKNLSYIIPDLSINEHLQYVVINEIANKYNLFVIDGSLACHDFACTVSTFASKVCHLFPFLGYGCTSLDLPNFELLSGITAYDVDKMMIEDSNHNIISCKNPLANKHWARMTGDQRILIARLHQIRKEKLGF